MSETPDPRRPDARELDRLKESLSAPGRRTMTRAEVLGWNRRWSASDTQTLVRHLERVGAVRFNRTGDDAYVRCLDPQDRVVMVVAPGYLTFPRPWVNEECAPDWPGIALSTLGSRAPEPVKRASRRPAEPRERRTPPRAESAPQFCPRCFLQLTTTGACGNCD